MEKQWKEAMRAEWATELADLCCRWLVFTGEHVNADIYQELLRQHVVRWGWRLYPDIKYIFLQIQHQPTSQKPPSGCWRNSGFWQIGCYICQTWTRLTSLSSAFCRLNPRLRLTQIWLPYDHPLLRNLTSNWQYTSSKPAAHSAAAAKPSLRKMKVKLNR
jgi:hypothetical protein